MPVTRRSDQPWYSVVNVDFIVKLVNNTVLHPFICCLVPLCLRAGETPYTEPVMVNTIAWAIFITIFALLNQLGNSYAYGSEREIDEEDEVVVITGGSSGLGRCIAEIYAMKGASVAVLDKKGTDDSAVVEGVNYYLCDVSDRKQVEAAWKDVNKDLGLPTILVNNAGIVHGKTADTLSAEEVTA
jgi:ribosomal protein L24